MLFLFAIFILAGCQAGFESANKDENVNLPAPLAAAKTATSPEAIIPPPETPKTPEVNNPPPAPPAAPEKPPAANYVNLPVAFASQAPFGNWDAVHEEACEEASMIMAEKYFHGGSLSAHLMDQAILDLIAWEEANGYHVDLNAEETVVILKSYYSLSAELETDVSATVIKNILRQGKLVIIPAAGRSLGNPNFTGAGPIYHMLVVRGFDDRTGEFITNDPGTRKGEGYRYKYQVLINAVHDWNPEAGREMTEERMGQGRKVIIVVAK